MPVQPSLQVQLSAYLSNPTPCDVSSLLRNFNPFCLLETQFQYVEATQPDPGKGLPNQLFVPDAICSQVLRWAHSSRLTCQVGKHRTLAFLHQHFWWPTVDADIYLFCLCPKQNLHQTQLWISPLFCLPLAPGYTSLCNPGHCHSWLILNIT